MFAVYFGGNRPNLGDSIWSIHVAMSVVKEGNTDLDEYENLIAKYNQYAVQNINGHVYYYFPIDHPFWPFPCLSIDKASNIIFQADLNDYLSQNLALIN